MLGHSLETGAKCRQGQKENKNRRLGTIRPINLGNHRGTKGVVWWTNKF